MGEPPKLTFKILIGRIKNLALFKPRPESELEVTMHYKSKRHEMDITLFKQLDRLERELKNKVEHLLEPIRKLLWWLIGGKKKVEASDQAWRENKRLANEEDRTNALNLIERGEHGEVQGDLWLIWKNIVFSDKLEEARIARVILLDGEDPSGWKYQKARMALEEEHLLNRANLEAAAKDRELPTLYYLELPLGTVTAEELTALCQKLKGRYAVQFLRDLFSRIEPRILIPFEVGERIDLGSCTHHSGEIEAWGIVLPTGRMAIFGRYAGERAKNGTQLLGVAPDPSWSTDLSAKDVAVDTTGLTQPTEEEFKFLKTGVSEVRWGNDGTEDDARLLDEPRLLEGDQDE